MGVYHRQSACVGGRPGVKGEICQFRVGSEFLEAKEVHGGSRAENAVIAEFQEDKSGDEPEGLKGKPDSNPRIYILPHLVLANQCMDFVKHLGPAPFLSAASLGCGPGHQAPLSRIPKAAV